jgi:hypothetical protein
MKIRKQALSKWFSFLFCTSFTKSYSWNHYSFHNSRLFTSNKLKSLKMTEEIPLEKLQLGSSTSESLRELLANGKKLGYVDVHAHLIHERFENKENDIAETCIQKGMDFVIVNGIEPISNRKILEFCNTYSPYMQPAIGIYPLDAANAFIFTEKDKDKDPSVTVNWKNEFPPPEKFNVDEEIAFIEEHAKAGTIIAIGECGLDKHYLTDEISFAEQERVLRHLMKVSHNHLSFLLPFFLSFFSFLFFCDWFLSWE